MQALKNERNIQIPTRINTLQLIHCQKSKGRICIEPQTNTKTEIQPEDHNPYNRVSKQE